jgi:hypothetical protein
LIRRGQIRAFTIGTAVRIPPEAVAEAEGRLAVKPVPAKTRRRSGVLPEVARRMERWGFDTKGAGLDSRAVRICPIQADHMMLLKSTISGNSVDVQPDRSTGSYDLVSVRVISVRRGRHAGPPSPAEDAAAFATSPPDAAVRYRYLVGTWPTEAEVAELHRRHLAAPRLRPQPLADVLHLLIGVADRRAV